MTGILTRAGPAEILRASQKDDLFCDKLKSLLYEIVLNIGGTRALLKYRDFLTSGGNTLYYGMTTLSGLQTLGEEYTGILQFDTAFGNIPTEKKRILMILFSEFGQTLISRMMLNVEKNYLKNEKSGIRSEARHQLINILAYLKVMGPFLEQLHRALFYWTGFYYYISKRMTGVQYILVRYWLKNRDSLYGFKLLSIITMVQILIAGTTKSINFWKLVANEQTQTSVAVVRESNSSVRSKTCPLCLDERKNVSLTPCGHLFCWYCIHEWIRNEQKCPICRETVLPSRVVPLRNYS